jgi:predicted alpha-1,6-mannanase (GH76 family)
MKLKMAADRVLKRFWRENRKEDAFGAFQSWRRARCLSSALSAPQEDCTPASRNLILLIDP